MITSNINVSMSGEDIRRFHSEMDRKCKGLLSDAEKKRIIEQDSIYNSLLKRHGGVNPLFRR